MVDTDKTRHTTDDGRQTTPWVWHKLPTGELKNYQNFKCLRFQGILKPSYLALCFHLLFGFPRFHLQALLKPNIGRTYTTIQTLYKTQGSNAHL